MNSQKLEGASVCSALYSITLGVAESYVGTAFHGLGLMQGLGANRTHRSQVSASPVAFGGVPQRVRAERRTLPSQRGVRALNLPGAFPFRPKLEKAFSSPYSFFPFPPVPANPTHLS